jgi:hypothetical protein
MVIIVDDISSISESIFSLKNKGKVIREPLLCKSRKEKNAEVHYHLGPNDLERANELFPEIFPYHMCVAYNEYRRLSKNQYIDLMKYRLYEIIKSGKMAGLLNYLGIIKDSEIEIKWHENKPGIKKPSKIN